MPKRKRTTAEMVRDDFNKEIADVKSVVILYETHDGTIGYVTDQRDRAGMIYFVERAKSRLVDGEPPPNRNTAS